MTIIKRILKQKTSLAILMVCITLGVLSLNQVLANSDSLIELRNQLASQTQVPVVLPTKNPQQAASISFAEADTYMVRFTASANCVGQEGCTRGTMVGRALETAYEWKGGTSVALSNGITADYFAFDPTEPYTNAHLIWTEGDYRYELGMSEATAEEMLEVANSAYE